MLIKIFYSIIVSLFLATGATYYLDKNKVEKWELTNTYNHISNRYNVDFNVFTAGLNFEAEKGFNRFINQLDNQVALQVSKNACSDARGTKASPSVLVSFDRVNEMKIVILNEDMEAILACEKFIDDEIASFEVYTNEFLRRIGNIRNGNETFISPNKNASKIDNNENENLGTFEDRLRFQFQQSQIENQLHNTLQSIIKNSDTRSDQKLTLADMKEIEIALKVLDYINIEKINNVNLSDQDDIEFNVNFDIIKKITRSLVNETQDNKKAGLSIFLFTQIIFLVIFIIMSDYFKLRQFKIKKKIATFLK
jgi:hypothetical protein